MKLRELVSRSVPTVGMDQTTAEALALMRDHRVDILPVVEHGRLAGSVELRGIVLDQAYDAPTGHRPRRVADCCNPQPMLCEGEVSLRSAMELLLKNGGDHLLVPNGEGTRFGVVMARDLIRYLIQYLPADREVPEMDSVKRIRGGEPTI